MDPNQLLQKGREELIKELNIGEYTPEEQDIVIEKLGEYIMRRVLTKMFDAVTADEDRATIEKLITEENFTDIRTIVGKYIPDVDAFTQQEVRAGIDDHKKAVADMLAGNPSAAA